MIMNEEDIEKIARKVLELQAKEAVKEPRPHNQIAEVTRKYHRQVYDKFGVTGTIDSAIRTVAIYSQGQRYISNLNGDELQKAKEFAEFLYQKLLGENENA